MIENIKQASPLTRKSPPAVKQPVTTSVSEDTFQSAQAPAERGVNWRQLAMGVGLLAATAVGTQAAHAQEVVVEADISQPQVVDLTYNKQGDTTMKRTSSARERREERRNRSSVRHRSDGTVEHRHGNTGHRSDGVIEQRHGDFVHGSDGSVTWSPQ